MLVYFSDWTGPREGAGMRIVVVYNASNAMAVDSSMLVSAYCASQGFDCVLVSSLQGGREPVRGCDLVVALGGDGTMLRAAHLASAEGTPILGINYGHLGFLANRVEQGVIAAIASALSGDIARDERANLRIDVLCEGDDEDAFEGAGAAGAWHRSYFALNEVAIARGPAGRIVHFEMFFNGFEMGRVRGDGVVVSSATGSTAYALSAGGPLVAPGYKGLIVVPIAPHSLMSRAILTDPNDVVEVAMGDDDGDREAVLFVDGLLEDLENPAKRVRVVRGSVPTTLLRYSSDGFYAHAASVFF